MGGLSEAGQALQARLTQKFINSLPDKRKQISDCWMRLESSGWADEDLNQLKIHAHRLSGSAGSYGLDDLGEAAGSLNRAMKTGVDSPEQQRVISSRVEVLLRLLKSASPENS